MNSFTMGIKEKLWQCIQVANTDLGQPEVFSLQFADRGVLDFGHCFSN